MLSIDLLRKGGWFAYACGAVLLTLAGVIGSIASADAEPEPRHPRPTARERRTVFAPGVVEGGSREIGLRFEIAGRLDRVVRAEGEHVRAGTLIAVIDDALLAAELRLAEGRVRHARDRRRRLVNGASAEARAVAAAGVDRAAIAARFAGLEYARVESLKRRQATTASAWDAARETAAAAAAELARVEARAAEIAAPARPDDLAIADAEIAIAEAELDLARRRLDRTELLAPVDGTVLRIDNEPGQLVGPVSATPAVRFVAAGPLRVRAYVDEFDALRVEPGRPARVTADGRSGEPYEGTVIRCSPTLGPKTVRSDEPGERFDVRTREILVELADPAGLVIGMPVDVAIGFEDAGAPSPSRTR